MARRDKRNSRLLLLGTAVILILAAIAALVPPLLNPNRTKPRLPVGEYLAQPQSFAGNKYLLEGEIADRLAHSSAGTVYSVAALPSHEFVAVCLPSGAEPAFNIEKGQSLAIDLRIGENGEAVVTALHKK